MATPDDLAETARQVEALDRRIVATQADVRDYDALKQALDDGVAQLGRLDIVSANAGVFGFGTGQPIRGHPRRTARLALKTDLPHPDPTHDLPKDSQCPMSPVKPTPVLPVVLLRRARG
jgi:NAD(P)-dependent dehydrogenase (short-subunit alcohol dehydrogenase family)